MTTPPPPAVLRIGFVSGVTLTKWTTTWHQRFPGVALEVIAVAEPDQRRVLTAGEVDMCFVRLPLTTEGLHVIRLYDEVPVVWVSTDHPIAAFDEVSTADLADENVLHEVDQESIDLVAQEAAVLRVPMSVARSHSRRDLTYRPVTDAAETTVALAWRVDAEHRFIDEFVGVVRGRTANSSRTAQQRSAGQPAPKPAKQAKPAAAAKPPRQTGRPRQRRR